MEKKKTLSGYAIVIATHGWIFVGKCDIDKNWCVITGAKTIRVWGTKRGIGELAENGPTERTKLDDGGVIRIPLASVVATLDTEESKWK